MSNSSTHWSKNELQAYILLYCANANFVEKPAEIDLIKSKVDTTRYKAIHQEFDNDNDYQSIEKIIDAVNRLNLSDKQTDKMILEIKELFMADGDFDAAEKALFSGLKHILK